MTEHATQSLEKELNHVFKNRDLLTYALTHSSMGGNVNYERLEFLGDRVLGLIVAQILFSRFPKEKEGDLAKRLAALVQGSFLAQIARKINLGNYIVFSDAERQAGGQNNENILADVFESLLGALYLDSGFDKCYALIDRLWADSFFEMKAPPQHPKTTVQEWSQSQSLPLPTYEIIEQSGPDHMPTFTIQLSIQGHDPITAQSTSRQRAEKKVAQIFIEKMNIK
jgi:ribonuclease-3